MSEANELPPFSPFGISFYFSNMLRRFFIGLAASLGLMANAQLSDSLALARITKIVEAKMALEEVQGAAICLIRNDSILDSLFFGYADLKTKAPVDAETKFRWASISKPVTALAAMQLVEQGRLDLQQPAMNYFPAFPEKKKGNPTVRQVMCHQAGINSYCLDANNKPVCRWNLDHYKGQLGKAPWDADLSTETFRDFPLIHPPGSKYRYTTFGYNLLGAIIGKVTERNFVDHIGENVFEPLGLNSVQPDYQSVDIPGRATGYKRKFGKIIEDVDSDVSWKVPGGGLISN
ncbi:MAG: serine hydrolase domain-containing protein, partial [Bacteroidota bacterium]